MRRPRGAITAGGSLGQALLGRLSRIGLSRAGHGRTIAERAGRATWTGRAERAGVCGSSGSSTAHSRGTGWTQQVGHLNLSEALLNGSGLILDRIPNEFPLIVICAPVVNPERSLVHFTTR